MKITTFLTILPIIFSTLLPAQETKNWPQELANAMELQAQGNYKDGTGKFNTWCRQQPREALDAVLTYVQNPEPKVRSLAFSLVYTIGRNAKDTVIRTDAVLQLAGGCADGLETTSTSVCKYLQYFKKTDFSLLSRKIIIDALKNKPELMPKLARLVGYLELKELTPVLKTYTEDFSLTNRQKWEAWLALARMGDSDAIDYILSQIKTIPVNDDVMYQFAPDLIYTRQHKAFDYLIEILNSDNKDCYSSNPDNSGKIVCAFRVMEFLAPVVEGFPLKVHASGDIDAKDYNEALQRVRKWFKGKKGKYVIMTEGF